MEGLLPHTPEEKRKAILRLRRIAGQVAGVESAIEAGTSCSAVLQQIAALRGAVNGLMSEVLESHLRETFGPFADVDDESLGQSIDDAVTLVRRYLK